MTSIFESLAAVLSLVLLCAVFIGIIFVISATSTGARTKLRDPSGSRNGLVRYSVRGQVGDGGITWRGGNYLTLWLAADAIAISSNPSLPGSYYLRYSRDEDPVVTLVGRDAMTVELIRISGESGNAEVRLPKPAHRKIADDLSRMGWSVERAWS